jgi:hypothetical protein
VLVATFTVHVLRTAKFMKGAIEGRLEEAAARRGVRLVFMAGPFRLVAWLRDG